LGEREKCVDTLCMAHDAKRHYVHCVDMLHEHTCTSCAIYNASTHRPYTMPTVYVLCTYVDAVGRRSYTEFRGG
jgi:hypothetical protein